jgi:hypothetical protein
VSPGTTRYEWLTARLGRLPHHWRWGLGAFAAYRLLLSSWALLLWLLELIPHSPRSPYYSGLVPLDGGPAGALIGVWERWDVIHYARIAAHGYRATDLSAFHPLFPELGGLLARSLGLQPTAALFLVANLALCLGLVALYRLVALEFGDSVSRATLLCLLAFPGAFFLAAPYAESLTLLLAILAIAEIRRSRGAAALVLGIGAGLSHFTSLPVTGMLLVEAVRQGRDRPLLTRLAHCLPALGPPLGTALFLAWRAAQGLPGWGATHRQLWGVVIRWPWEQLLDLGEVFRSAYFPLTGWFNLLVLVLALAATIWWLRERRDGWGVYLLAMVLMLLCVDVPGEPLASWIRHALLLPPLFIAAARITERTRIRPWLLLIGAALQLYFSALFMSWIWVG